MSASVGIVFFVLNVRNFDGFLVKPEILTDVQVKPCFDKEKLEALYPDDSLGSLFEMTDRQFCVAGKTNKRKEDYAELGNHVEVVSVSPIVRFKWTKLGCIDCEPTFCPIKFFGYRETYRLSPDFGYYKECNSQLSQYRHELVRSMSTGVMEDTSFVFPFHHECPITELPLKYENHLACKLKPDQWYLVEYSSWNEIEMRNKSTLLFPFKNYWVFSTHDFFLPDSGHEKFFVFKSKSLSCGLKVLVYIKSDLPFDVNVELEMTFAAENQSSQKIKQINLINLSRENAWDEIVYQFATNFSLYSVDICYKGSASVALKSRNITALLANGNQWLCAYNRIHCFPPPVASKTNIWPNKKLTLFLLVVIMYNVVFISIEY